MRNSIRCCISCILPCGALDVIRIVHSNGYVEEISGSIKASDVMKAHPKHVLKKPSSPSSSAACADDASALPKIVIVPPEADLQRGKIYFLMPLPPNPDKPRSRSSSRRKKRVTNNNNKNNHHSDRTPPAALASATADTDDNDDNNNNNSSISMSNLHVSDQYLSEILSEKASTHRERRRGRVGVWRPHLESICESPSHV
ncbi:rhoGEF domain-containing protein gxcI-like [Cucurbita maxima]|uniref:RhoGEF domain-containing protein gxcI-like n=1 Tax=Cucurbita maxima TaxID=3661 RepID=A0A6J1KLR7_CUCMA|nr:rhoGEF domain-containing protein gxcI-like [Cucurbita maxima]